MYSQFSQFYDALMEDVDYQSRTEYILSLFEKYDKKPTLLLDLACGTGSFSVEFAKQDISVIGVDMSPEMLSVAMEKSKQQELDVLYLCQNAAELDLYGTVDGAVCCMDSLNHIIDYDDICEIFKKVSLFLEEGRLFIFDVNTPYKHKNILGDNTFVIEQDNIFCVWDNSYDEESAVTSINLDFFVSDEQENYKRYSDYIEERAYSDSELKSALAAAGFEVLAVLGELSYQNTEAQDERVFYVARKVK